MTHPDVQGRCPACGWTTLFLASGGYITCSRADCPDPDAASTLLERDVRTHPTTCDATEIIDLGLIGGPATFGPCVLRHNHDGPGHKGANGAQWWPTGHTHASTANRAADNEVAVPTVTHIVPADYLGDPIIDLGAHIAGYAEALAEDAADPQP